MESQSQAGRTASAISKHLRIAAELGDGAPSLQPLGENNKRHSSVTFCLTKPLSPFSFHLYVNRTLYDLVDSRHPFPLGERGPFQLLLPPLPSPPLPSPSPSLPPAPLPFPSLHHPPHRARISAASLDPQAGIGLFCLQRKGGGRGEGRRESEKRRGRRRRAARECDPLSARDTVLLRIRPRDSHRRPRPHAFVSLPPSRSVFPSESCAWALCASRARV